MQPDGNGGQVASAVADFESVRVALARFGYELTNEVQGQAPRVWFLCSPNCLPFRIGHESEVRRVLAMHERFSALPDSRARIERWRAKKLRTAQRRMGWRP